MQLQHLLHPGPRRRGGRRRPGGHAGGPPGRSRVRLEGRDARGVLVVHAAGDLLAGRGRAEHDPRRRWRRDAARAQGHRVRGGRCGSRPFGCGLGGVPGDPLAADTLAGGGPAALDEARRGRERGDRGDDNGRAPPLPDGRERRVAVPRDQRERLGDEVEVRQPLRLPAFADRRHQPRHRRDDRRQGGGRLWLRRRRQGLCGIVARPGRPRGDHRDRSDLRAAGGDAGL